jgi:hypothetical protein
MSMVMIDVEKVKAGVQSLKSASAGGSGGYGADAQSDPRAFLAKHGITIDADLEAMIKDRLDAVSRGEEQASAIHFDVG